MVRISSNTADNNPLMKRIVRPLCFAIASLVIAAGFVMLQGQDVSAESRHDVASNMTLRLAQADTQMNDAAPVLVITGKPAAQERKQIRVIPLFNVPADQAQTVERR
ncbi:hypothetical protein PY365_28320 [Roseiarcaceae bacterium H3SJ34-1]|uniref:hypothetical protein n=1 Tax=Terripilifer ovatus TaxID=3032367 RepID=UPI003AB93EC3|nr:hypothetical protein [Roseiarcaceae bacterium H3SJ34-1]